MTKIFKWLSYFIITVIVIIIMVLSLAYLKRDKILKELTAELNGQVAGEFKIKKLDFTFFHNFPNFSISLHEVSLKDSLFAQHRQDVFLARHIFLDVALLPLWKREISIKALTLNDASFFIYKGRDGYTNINVLKKRDEQGDIGQADGSIIFSIEKILCNDVAIVYTDSANDKMISLTLLKTSNTISRHGKVYDVDLKGDVHVDQLTFNSESGHYLTNNFSSVDLHLSVDNANKLLTLHSSLLHFDKLQVDVAGAFELKKSGRYNLTFKSDNVSLKEAKLLLNDKINRALQALSITEPVQIDVGIAGVSMPGYKPDVDIAFQANDVTMKYRKLNFDALSFSGTFNNHLDSTRINDDANAQIRITYFKGNLDRLPVRGRIDITTLKDPVIDLSFTSTIKYSDLNKDLDTNRIVLNSGKFKTDISYSGKLSEYIDRNRTHYDGKLKGTLTAINASVLLKSKRALFTRINARCDFNEETFSVRDLTFKVNNDPVSMTGTIKNFIPFFTSPKNKGMVQLKVSAPHLDMTWLSAKPQFVKRTRVQREHVRKKMTDIFDRIYQKLEFSLAVNTGQLSFRGFVAKDFSGIVKLNNTTFTASPVKMKVANGTIDLTFTMRQLFNDVSPISFKADVKNAEIKNFFISFDNFNQHTVHSDNISGSISALVKFDADVDEQYRVIPSTMRGELDCKIKDGTLKEFPPLMSMSNFLFKERDFSDVAFAEIKSKFSIRGPAVEIGRMEIQSTVLSLFLQGYYSFQDSTTLSVQIPLSNLRRRNKNYKPENVGTDTRVGPSIFLHVHNNREIKGKMIIDYDPFKKWMK